MANKGTDVAYIDRAGVAHVALVVGVNNLNPDVLDLAYFDLKADALKTEFGVMHMSDPSKDESNPDLPRYSLNCWKERGEEHKALPADHPAFDHPFELKQVSEAGHVVQKERPKFDRHVAEHQAGAGGIPIPPSTRLPECFLQGQKAPDSVDPGPLAKGESRAEEVAENLHALTGAQTEVIGGIPVVDVPAVESEPDVSTQLDATGALPKDQQAQDPA